MMNYELFCRNKPAFDEGIVMITDQMNKYLCPIHQNRIDRRCASLQGHFWWSLGGHLFPCRLSLFSVTSRLCFWIGLCVTAKWLIYEEKSGALWGTLLAQCSGPWASGRELAVSLMQLVHCSVQALLSPALQGLNDNDMLPVALSIRVLKEDAWRSWQVNHTVIRVTLALLPSCKLSYRYAAFAWYAQR